MWESYSESFWDRKVKVRLVVILLVSLICMYLVLGVVAHGDGKLSVSFLDVGQGDAIYIEGPTGNQLLIDGGPGRMVLARLGEQMPFLDRSLDVVMATHADQDHVGGLPDVIASYDTALLLETGNPSESTSYIELERMADALTQESLGESGFRRILVQAGSSLDLGGGAILTIISPDTLHAQGETNASSVVARLTYGEHEFLLTGDAPMEVERHLMATYPEASLESDVLKVGHHGSRTSTAEDFLVVVKPKYAIISSGKNNKYGHPHQEVRDKLAMSGATPLETSIRGTITFKSDGTHLEYETER